MEIAIRGEKRRKGFGLGTGLKATQKKKKTEKGRKMWMHVDYVRATKGVIK